MDVLEFSFQSDLLKALQSDVRNFHATSCPVLIVGDTGSGKTTWARAFCRNYGVASLVEAHDAPKTVKGWRDLSLNWNKQPVILENVEKWSDVTQSAFLLFFKEQRPNLKKVIATASTRLIGKVREGQFRSDVYYTLAIRKIDLPRLNDCLIDFEKIVSFWLEVNALMRGQNGVTMSHEAMNLLKANKWHGNFSELINVVERALTLSKGVIEARHIQFEDWSHDYSELEAGLTLAEVEKKLIMQTLNLTAQNKSQAARILGISIRTLRNKLNEYRQEGAHELI